MTLTLLSIQEIYCRDIAHLYTDDCCEYDIDTSVYTRDRLKDLAPLYTDDCCEYDIDTSVYTRDRL